MSEDAAAASGAGHSGDARRGGGTAPGHPRLQFLLPLVPARLFRARQRIRDYLHEQGLEAAAVDDVVMAVQEAMTNAVQHSGASDDVEVSLSFVDDDLVAEVSDRGCGFDIAGFDGGELPGPEELGGRGLYLMACLMDDIALCADHGLAVRMRKRNALGGRDIPAVSTSARAHSDARQLELLEEVDEGVFMLDWEYRFTFANSAVQRLVGVDAPALLGRTLWDVFPKVVGTEAARAQRDAMELGIPAQLEYISPTLGRWLELRVYCSASGVIAFSRDIDERKRKELAHDESRRRAELLARCTALLLASSNPQEVVEELCRSVMAEIDCQIFLDYLVDETSGRLHLNACGGITEEESRDVEWLSCDAADCGCAASRRHGVVEQVPGGEDPRAGLIIAHGITAYVCHPLVVEDHVLGCLAFGSCTRTRFSTDDLALINAIADQGAIALQRQRAERGRLRYELLAADSDDIILFVDATGAILDANLSAERAYGYSRAELLGLTIRDLRAADTRDDVPRQMAEADRQGLRFETVHQRKNGETFPVEVSSRGGFIEGRRVLMSIARDVTERRRVELALRDSEERLRLAGRAGRVGLFTWAVDQDIAYWNDEHYALFGMEVGVPPGYQGWRARLHPDDVQGVESRLDALLRRGRSAAHTIVQRDEYRVVHGDGNVRWLDSYVELEPGVDGPVIRGAVHDVTSRRRTEEDVRQLAEQRRLALDAAKLGWWHYDPASRVATYDQGYREIFDVEGEERPNDEILRRLHPDDLAGVWAKVEAALDPADPQPYAAEYRIFRGEGSVRWVEAHGIATFAGEGDRRRAVALVGTVQDITERKQAQASISRQNEILQGIATILEAAYTTSDEAELGGVCLAVALELTSSTDGLVAEPGEDGRLRAIATRCSAEQLGGVGSAQDDRVPACEALLEFGERVLATGSPLTVVYGADDSPNGDRRERPSLTALLGMPLEGHGQTLGVVTLGTEQGGYQDGQREALEGVTPTIREAFRRMRAEATLRDSEERYRLLHNTLRDAFIRVDMDGRIAECNGIFCEMLGYTIDELRALTYKDLTPPTWHAFEEAIVREQILPRGYSDVYEKEYRRKDGALIQVELRTVLLRDHQGRPEAMWAIVRDVTERKAAHEELRASRQELATELEAARSIQRLSLHLIANDGAVGFYDRLLAATVETLHAAAASICVLTTESDCAGVLALVGQKGLDEAGAAMWQGFRPGPESIHSRVLASAARVAVDDLEAASFVESSTDAEIYARLGIRATQTTPVLARSGALLGFFSSHWREPHELTGSEGRTLDVLARQAAELMERQRAEDALRDGERRYKSLFEALREGFVHPLPEIEGLEVAVLTVPASRPELIGGDFHDVWVVPDGRVMVLIGDVMGKGVQAAGLTETVRSAARALSLTAASPATIMRHVNQMLLAEGQEQFVTVQILTLDLETGRSELASGGHPPPILAAEGDACPIEPVHGPLLGAVPYSYGATAFALPPAASLVLYTDGVTEARRNREMYSERRLLDAVKAASHLAPQELANRVLDDVLGFAGALSDDLEILVLRRGAR